jgi:hypothetical protein
MPATSEAQRRAMYAAAEGRGVLGIPKPIGEEFVGKDSAGQARVGSVSHQPPCIHIGDLSTCDGRSSGWT